VEQPNVKTQLDSLGETLDGVLASLKDTYASEYPDAPPLSGADETTPPPTEDTAMLKSFVSMGRDRLMRASGLVARLNAAVSLSPRVAAAAAPVLKSLREMIRDAKKPDANSFKPVTDELAKLKSAFRK
jgi:hypothetical protein